MDSLSGVIYTFHELDIAIKRKDDLWVMRLLSHMKGIYVLLDSVHKESLDSILSLTSPMTFNACTHEMIKLLDNTML